MPFHPGTSQLTIYKGSPDGMASRTNWSGWSTFKSASDVPLHYTCFPALCLRQSLLGECLWLVTFPYACLYVCMSLGTVCLCGCLEYSVHCCLSASLCVYDILTPLSSISLSIGLSINLSMSASSPLYAPLPSLSQYCYYG